MSPETPEVRRMSDGTKRLRRNVYHRDPVREAGYIERLVVACERDSIGSLHLELRIENLQTSGGGCAPSQ